MVQVETFRNEGEVSIILGLGRDFRNVSFADLTLAEAESLHRVLGEKIELAR